MDSQWLGFLVTVGLGLAVYYFFFRCRDLESEECSPKKDKMSK